MSLAQAMINVKNYILTFLRFTAIFSSLNCYVVYAHDMPPVLVNQDFTAQMEDETVTLGERWTDDVARKIEVPIEGYFVGEVPFDGTHYKFYQHQKAGFDIYVSNLWWDKVDRNVDDYIVSQITLTTGEGKTPRGIHVGSTARELSNAYGKGQMENDAGEQWCFYQLGNKLLSFGIKDSKVVTITMNYDNGAQE